MSYYRLLAVLLITLPAAASSFAASPVTQAEYTGIINQAVTDLETVIRMENDLAGSGTPLIDKLIAGIPSSLPVRDGDNVVTADLYWMKRELNNIQKLTGKARIERLDHLTIRMRTLAAAIKPERQVPTGKARDTLDAVLAKKEYQTSPLDTWGQRLMRAITDLLSRIKVPPATAKAISWIIVGAAGMIFVTVLVWLTLQLINRYYSKGSRRSGPEKQVQVTKRAKPAVETLLTSAEQAASEGHYREAFRFTYLASLMLLDKSQLIKYTESGTNWEYLRILKHRSEDGTADVFQSLTHLFDELIYGKHEVSQQDYLKSLEHFRNLEAAV